MIFEKGDSLTWARSPALLAASAVRFPPIPDTGNLDSALALEIEEHPVVAHTEAVLRLGC